MAGEEGVEEEAEAAAGAALSPPSLPGYLRKCPLRTHGGGLPNRNSRAWSLRFGTSQEFVPGAAAINPSARAVEYCEITGFLGSYTDELMSHEQITDPRGFPSNTTNRYYWGIRTREDWSS